MLIRLANNMFLFIDRCGTWICVIPCSVLLAISFKVNTKCEYQIITLSCIFFYFWNEIIYVFQIVSIDFDAMYYCKIVWSVFFCLKIVFKSLIVSSTQSVSVARLYPHRIIIRVRISLPHHAYIFRDDMMNIHHSTPHVLHLLSSKITSLSMVKRLQRSIEKSRHPLRKGSRSDEVREWPRYGNG